MKKPRQPAIAKSDVELARLLNTDRKSLRRWRRAYPAECPPDLNVSAWQSFLERNLRGPHSPQRHYGEDASTAERDGSLRAWTVRHDQLQCRRIEQKIRSEAEELTLTADLENALGLMLVAFRAAVDHFVIRAAARVRGLSDFHGVVEVLQTECDALLHGLYRADYLGEDILPGILAAQPVPDGFCAEAWREAVAAVTKDAIRRIGRLALPK